MSITRKVKYRTDIFFNLTSEEHIVNALDEFGAVLNSNNYQLVLEDIQSQPFILELVLSNISSDIPLHEWMVATFPMDANLFIDSFPSKVLDRLSTFFLMQFPHAIQPPRFANETSKFLSQTPQVLHALFAMAFVEDVGALVTQSRPQLSTKTKANSQRYQKRLKKLSSNLQHEDVLLKANIAIPCTKAEAMEIAASILNKLRYCYETYLSGIRSPEVSQFIRESCITTEAPLPLQVVTHSGPSRQTLESSPMAPINETAPAPLLHLKLSHYYDTPDGFGEWNILLSTRADRALRDWHKNNSTTYEIVRRKIIDLSNGHFSRDNHKRLNGLKTEIPVYEAKITGDLRLIYIVDCILSPTDNQRETQGKWTTLKVFDFCTHAKMDHRLWDSVAGYLQSQGKEYRTRCLKRQRRVGDTGDAYIPASFPAREDEKDEDREVDVLIADLVQHDNNELHSIITLEKYVALSKDVLESIEADREGTFPFELSRYEKKIAEHPKSCYVLGRSGTGKTTTMLHKMLWVQRAYHLHTANTQRPRQVFVTRSSVLARKVEEHFSTYMAAGKINEFRTRFAQSESSDLINQNGFSAWKESKATFKGLKDEDFPLFIPLEDLYYLLEGDIDWNSKPFLTLGTRFRPLAEYKGKSISFHRFLGEYWPTFSKRLTNTTNPALVFNEIIGVISGSEKTLGSEQGRLSKEQYLESSRAASSNFTQQQRGAIYDIFVLYLKLKHQHDDYDISDRSRTIIAALKHGALTIRKIDHLYVDEAQDNLLIDALVLRLLCRNPDGLFWAGDTAQTISAGSAFRFEDLKAFMYRIEKQRLKKETNGSIVKQISPVPPHVFQLATNFRSHAGIVDCAHIVVELIKKYFPSTIDILKRERGVVEGAKPMFCSDFDSEQFKERGVLSNSDENGEQIELGAHQCILVRDDAARERFLDEIGDIGLVVTLYDSKGLEFNDVILLNFFEDSNLTREQWSVVLNMAPGSPYAPKFDLLKHSGICLELKSLYVAITRARNNLRIVDRSEKSEPMKILWEKLGHITSASFQRAFKNFAVQSSKQDWIKRAKELFDQEKYALSRDAYLRGQSYRNAAVASAYYEREGAQRTPVQVSRNKPNLRSERFTKAAEAFIRSADQADGKGGRKKYHHIVADCYEEAGVFSKAVQYHRLAGNFTRAAVLLRKQGLFDDVKDIMTTHGDEIDPTILQNLKDVARLYFVSSKDYSKVHELFDSPEDEIEYLEDRNLDLAQVDLYLQHGRITEAAEVHLADGRFHEAASLLISDKEDGSKSLKDAISAILQGLRTYITFGSDPSGDSRVSSLLALAEDIPDDVWVSDERYREEIMLYKSLYSRQVDSLFGMVDGLLARKDVQAALLILDFIFETPPEIDELLEVAKRNLSYFSHYVKHLHDAAYFADPGQEKHQKLFGVVQHNADTFSFRPGTLIAAFQAGNAEYASLATMKKVDLVAIFRQCMQQRLRQKVVDENIICRRAPVFDPCLRHVALGDCDPATTQCHRPHITTDEKWFQDWIRIHLLQIYIYNTVRRLELPDDALRQQLFWLKKFHEAINPPHHAMGSLSCLTRDLVDAMRREFFTVLNWIREVTERLDIHPDYRFLTTAMLSADLAFIFDRKEASTYIYRSRFVQPDIIDRKFLRWPTMENSLKELLVAFHGKGPDSLLMGVLFIRHVVKKEIKVNINVLCTFIEKICGLLVVHNTFVYHHSFHNITLPHSWLKRILHGFDHQDAVAKKKDFFNLMLEPLNELLWRLYFGDTQSNHLLFGSKYVSIPNGIRKIFIARICRVLGLLGYNISVPWFREKILQIFKSLLASQHQGFPRLYARYIYSSTFDDVSKATRRSMMGSSLDEMVVLIDLQMVDDAQAPVMGVRRIMYYTEEDLATSLGLAGPPVGLDSLENHDISGNIHNVPDHDELPGEDTVVTGSSADAAPAEENHEPTTQIPDDFYITHSEQEVLNARVIQRAYRRIQARTKLRESSGLDGRTYRCFEECLRSLDGKKMHRMKSMNHYRFVYLASLPQLVACIDAIYEHLLAAKVKVKERLPKLRHDALEELSERYTLLNNNIKALKEHRGAFGVDSLLHQRCDLEELRSQVELLRDVLHNPRFPITITKDVAESLQKVYHVALTRPRKPTTKTPKRPKLGVDVEDLGLAYMAGISTSNL
ncbi:hypothetical protein BJ165DRAFT_1529567 [Panaeolus papilionaceus]|nr:hypothetical protein BJ165DRAFT_1529567 [Panaeolus papilionaceus]